MKKSNVVKKGGKYFLIDTCQLNNPLGNMMDDMGLGNEDAVDGEYETMVFESDKNGIVKSWEDLDKRNYATEKEAKMGHKEMVLKWSKDDWELRKCSCGFKFANPGEFRNCDAFITKDGKGGVICPDCGRKYVFND